MLTRWRAAVVAGVAPIARAYAAVVFSGRPATGGLLAAATFLTPSRGLLGLLAVVVADLTARRLGFRADLRQAGYFGYSALLAGLALAHDHPVDVELAVLVAAAAIAATALTAVLGELCARVGLPVLALPYLCVATLLAHTTLGGEPTRPWLTVATDLPVTGGVARLDEILAAVGAVVFEPTRGGGLLVLAAALLWSRWLALTLLGGATIGVAVTHTLFPGHPSVALAAGYNAALTAAALGVVLFVPDRRSLVVGIVGAGLAAWLSVAWLAPFAPVSLPVLAWPFLVVTLASARSLALRGSGQSPWLALLPAAAPEANLRYVAMSRTRLALPGPPRFVLPVGATEHADELAPRLYSALASAYRSGPPLPDTWIITQGVGGAITHQEPWAHALDFEVVDRDGFPFRGQGGNVEDFYCFGQPVLAPGTGTVVLVSEGLPDNPPGTQDTTRPWGNAVVLQHGPGLYSVVAHLRRGSVLVREGDYVVASQPLAQCGASGRSPRPHLHFQAQAAPYLGAPTLDFRLVDFCTRGRGADRFHRLGVPREGSAVGAVAPDPILCALANLYPGRTLELGSERQAVRLRTELSLLGEHSLVDDRRGERLYFVPYPGGVIFTTLEGSAQGPLGVLYQTLPCLPVAQSLDVPLRLVEELPAGALLPGVLRLAYDLVRVVFDPLAARVRLELRWQDGEVSVKSDATLSAYRWTLVRRRGHARIDREGLRLLEQLGGPRWVRPPIAPAWESATAAGEAPYPGRTETCMVASS